MMSLDEWRVVFWVCGLVLMLVAASPGLGLVVSFPRGTERFSEFWVLGPNRMAEGYPFNVEVNETYRVFVGVGNHLGFSAYYLVYVKFRNQSQPLPNVTSSEPSPLVPLHEFRFFVLDGGTWETPLAFRILEVSRYDDSVFVGRISINDVVFDVDSFAKWDSEFGGFYFQLFFELWLYDEGVRDFRFHDRFVGIWLNMTV